MLTYIKIAEVIGEYRRLLVVMIFEGQ